MPIAKPVIIPKNVNSRLAMALGAARMGGFQCPKCQSSWFGTEQPISAGIRHCNDENEVGCKWRGSAVYAPPDYAGDLNEMKRVEEVIDDGKLREPYLLEVGKYAHPQYREWWLLTAPPDIRALAAVKVLEGKEDQ